MSEWAMMDAGMELDRIVAERLGYVVNTYQGYIRLIAPDGGIVEQHTEGSCSANVLWRMVWKHGYLPRYSTDLNAAFTLIPPPTDELRFVLSVISPKYRAINEGDWEADFNVGTSEDHRHYDAQAATPALAICKAWLAWQDAIAAEAS